MWSSYGPHFTWEEAWLQSANNVTLTSGLHKGQATHCIDSRGLRPDSSLEVALAKSNCKQPTRCWVATTSGQGDPWKKPGVAGTGYNSPQEGEGHKGGRDQLSTQHMTLIIENTTEAESSQPLARGSTLSVEWNINTQIIQLLNRHFMFSHFLSLYLVSMRERM